MSNILQVSEELESLGLRGISIEAIESLLSMISDAEDEVQLGDARTWDDLQALRSYWSNKLQALYAYLGS